MVFVKIILSSLKYVWTIMSSTLMTEQIWLSYGKYDKYEFNQYVWTIMNYEQLYNNYVIIIYYLPFLSFKRGGGVNKAYLVNICFA